MVCRVTCLVNSTMLWQVRAKIAVCTQFAHLGIAAFAENLCLTACCACAVTGTHVTPVVGFMQEDLTDMSVFQLSEAEVDFAFTLPIERMLDPAFVAVETLSNRPRVANSRATAQVPVFHGGPARVWGLTAWIMSEVLQNVVVPSFVEDEQLLKEDAARLQELLGKAAHPPNE